MNTKVAKKRLVGTFDFGYASGMTMGLLIGRYIAEWYIILILFWIMIIFTRYSRGKWFRWWKK